MYVVSTLRSGATAFCIDYAFNNNLTFQGELSPKYIRAGTITGLGADTNTKQQFHETGFQPTYSPEQFCNHINNLNSPNDLYLLNVAEHTTALPGASFYLTRKDIKASFQSLLNYFLKVTASSENQLQSKSFFFFKQITPILVSNYATLLQFCKDNNKQITWYEDVYDRQTVYEFYEAWTQKDAFDQYVASIVNTVDWSSLNPEIINRYGAL